MSLINNVDFLIHSLRLQYIRNVEDPYASRLITFNPSYASNPYIQAAGLADLDQWPEVAASASPVPSDDEGAGTTRFGPGGFPGAKGLRHTTTIMGHHRTGSVGMRVSGKRDSTFRPRSIRTQASTLRPGETPPDSAATTVGNGARQPPELAHKRSNLTIASGTTAADPPTPGLEDQNKGTETLKPAIFIPKFKMAADMESRRRQRIAARVQIQAPPTQKPMQLNPELSSSEDEGPRPIPESSSSSEMGDMSEEEEDYDQMLPAEDDMSDNDEFDPTFAREGGWDESMPSEIDLDRTYPVNTAPDMEGRLSPVDEGLQLADDESEEDTNDTTFEIVTVPPSQPRGTTSPLQRRGAVPEPPPKDLDVQQRPVASTSDIVFTRRAVPPMQPQKSALTAMLAATSTSQSENPFTELYAAISGRGASAKKEVRVYFPEATEPAGQPMDLTVRADATMEEVLGFALWTYWEEQWAPPLGDPDTSPEEDPRLSAVGWILRIAEEDGEVDEDFPPPDRKGKISKFNFDAYAALPANSTQMQQNRVLEASIQRRASRIMATRKKSDAAPSTNALAPPSTLALPGMIGLPESIMSPMAHLLSSSGPSSSYGPQQFLRIQTADAVDSVHRSTVVPVFSGTYMQEVLEMVCKRRKMDHPNEYALILENILVPLDRTVASLQGKMNLMLVRKSMLAELGIDTGTRTTRTTDPNASIFKRNSDVPEILGGNAVDYTASYKKYTVVRKLPMLGRHERILAIDGQYVHLMPSTSKARAVFENTRTMSYHIRSVAAVQQSSKASATFRLIVQRNGGAKRYDFEAESPRLAMEIVTTIKGLKAELDRKGTARNSRRSRQVV